VKAALVILDGAGLAEPGAGNAVTQETMPTLFAAMAEHGFATLEASGPAVGLDEGEAGNSEVGHLTIGAGYVVPSTLSRIDEAYRNSTWQCHPIWMNLGTAPRLHILGLLSNAGVHGHWRSLVQTASLAARAGTREIVVHAVLDGVDSQAGTAPHLLKQLGDELAHLPQARLGVIMGRKWFCDRSGNLELTRRCLETFADGPPLPPFVEADLDRHLETTSEATFAGRMTSSGRRLSPGEPVIITQHRADRAVQVTRLLSEITPVFTLVEIDPAVPLSNVFFPTKPLERGFAFELKQRNLHSVRIAESCKFPHVTYFLNGLNKDLEGQPVCVNSILEAAIAEKPEMSLEGVLNEIEAALRDPKNQIVIANIANLDQVGHLGNIRLASTAARYVDNALKRILALCREQGWSVLVTADHGNADCVLDESGRPFGSHTPHPVPFTAIPAPGLEFRWRNQQGSLANVAPSLLTLLDLPIPEYMSYSLIERSA
jgi:2,3-bisphosphoglycerate-independent phosphoglycerate mutase